MILTSRYSLAADQSPTGSDFAHKHLPARIAIDLGAESCRVSLLRWSSGQPRIELIHRLPNGPVHTGVSLCWPFDRILQGLYDGLVKAAEAAPEGIASIAVDGWAVDYVRLGPDGNAVSNPFCYRDERTLPAKEQVDRLISPEVAWRHAGAQPIRLNTVYQLFADRASGMDVTAPWVCLPEYVLHRLGARRTAEYTNATHTGLVDLHTRDWSRPLVDAIGIHAASLPTVVETGTIVGQLSGPLAQLPAYRNTQLIVPACHDTASAIAGIPVALDDAAYICSGTWSLVGTLIAEPITSPEALSAGFTNQGAAGGAFCFHTNVNGMWILKQCLESWKSAGRPWQLADLLARAAECADCPAVIPVEAPSLLLDSAMPERLNDELRKIGQPYIEDRAGNEPRFARLIFESLAARYASTLRNLEQILGRSLRRIHILGGGSQNKLLCELTARCTGLPVETGNVESSTIGNFAVQLAAAEGLPLRLDSIRRWAERLSAQPAAVAPRV